MHDSHECALRCRGLVKRYADVVAVAGIDLEIASGECFGLLGPNGAGKTTTVEIFEGLNPPDDGVIELFGWRWGAGRDHELRNRIGVCLQETQLADKLTVTEVIRLFRSFYRDGRPVEEVIGLVELDEKRGARVGKLSGGQRQRLALACALVSDPELLFLDEPTTGLDPQARLKVWDIIGSFQKAGGTVLLTTHYMEEAAELCDRVAIMDHGKIMAVGRPSDLVASLGANEVIEIELDNTIDPGELAQVPGVIEVIQRDGSLHLSVASVAGVLPDLLGELSRRNVALESLRTHHASLEDVFVKLTGRGLRDGEN